MAEPSGQFRGKRTHTHGEKTVEVTFHAVSYTHLDVYKRQESPKINSYVCIFKGVLVVCIIRIEISPAIQPIIIALGAGTQRGCRDMERKPQAQRRRHIG